MDYNHYRPRIAAWTICNVSGEDMMLNAAAHASVLNKEAAMMEVLYSIKRAGADIIITCFAKEAAKLMG